ncbi:DUF2459 domain-containing protein [Duganella fentianensis]|nr:DUF2459 domain-containing protein [Duganella fentianensis]
MRLLLLGCLLILTGCAMAPSRSSVPAAEAGHTIHLMRYGWHTALLFDGNDILSRSERLRTDLRPAPYILVGWGDGEYFVRDDAPWSKAVKALVASDYPAMQAGRRDSNPPAGVAAQDSLPLAITSRGMDQLVAYIDRSIALDGKGQPVYLGAQPDHPDRFYQGNGHYSLFNNCNSWIVGALRAAELPISGINLTASSVFEQAQQISALQQQMRTERTAQAGAAP